MHLIKSLVLTIATIATPVFASEKVQLAYAKISRVAPGLSGTVLVQDEPSEVLVHYRWQQSPHAMGEWKVIPAHFTERTAEGKALWSFSFLVPGAAPSAADFDFYVSSLYPYGRQQDGSEQAPFRIGDGYIDTQRPRVVLGDADFAIESADLSPRGGGSWFVTAWTRPDVIELNTVHSFDGWKTVERAEATPAYRLGGLQVWFIRVSATGVDELCMAFEMNGETFSAWANNDERNYCFTPKFGH